MNEQDVVAALSDVLLPKWQTERMKLDKIDKWARWDHSRPHRPEHATSEYLELAARAQAPWGDVIVGSIAQTLFAEGYRRPDAPEDSTGWDIWQANGMDARQVALHRSVLSYGLAYATCVPGKTLTGEPVPLLRGVSPREMIALYDDPANDEWAQIAMRVRRRGDRQIIDVYDAEFVHHLEIGSIGDKPQYQSQDAHGGGVVPVVRYTNRFDLEGRSAGEIEPFIPLLSKIDQTSFDRLVVQRFASWVVRTISGLSVEKTADATGETSWDRIRVALQTSDILTAEDPDARFGSLPATPMDGFIRAHDSDITTLAAVSQTPAFEMLGQLANMSAEALAAAKSSQTAKSDEIKHVIGESHEQLLRLACHMVGDVEGASDFRAQIRWADTSIRSLSQAADGLGKITQMLGFPAELLWAKVPGITQQDVDEAKQLVAQAGGIDALLAQLLAGQSPPAEQAPLPSGGA